MSSQKFKAWLAYFIAFLSPYSTVSSLMGIISRQMRPAITRINGIINWPRRLWEIKTAAREVGLPRMVCAELEGPAPSKHGLPATAVHPQVRIRFCLAAPAVLRDIGRRRAENPPSGSPAGVHARDIHSETTPASPIAAHLEDSGPSSRHCREGCWRHQNFTGQLR